MKIINAKVYTEEGIFEKKDVYTDGELISGKAAMTKYWMQKAVI